MTIVNSLVENPARPGRAAVRALNIKRRVDIVLHRTGVQRPQGEARLDASGVVAARYEDLGAGESEKG